MMYINPAIPQFTPTPVPTIRTCSAGRYDFLEFPFASLRRFIFMRDYLHHGFRLAFLALHNEQRYNGAYLVVYFAQRAS